MPKFDIAAITNAVRSPGQFAALLAILIFLSFLVLGLGPDERGRVVYDAGKACSLQAEQRVSFPEARVTLEYGRRLH